MEKNETLNINLLNAKNGNDFEFDISNYDLKGFFNEYNGNWYIDKDLLLNHSKKLSKNGYDYYITTDGTGGYKQLFINKEIADVIIDIIRVSEITTEKMDNLITNKTSKGEIKVMKNFGLSYNLFDDEIKMLSHFLDKDENGYGEYEGDDGWLKDNESINIIEDQLNQMKENRNLSKKIILDVLNDKDEKYPMNVKLFYITNVGTVINEKNEFLYDRKEFLNYTTIIKDLLIDYINKNNFIYQDNSKDIMNSILRNNKVEDFAERLSKDIPMIDFLNSNEAFGKVVQDYINNNTKICIELYGAENIEENELNVFREDVNNIINNVRSNAKKWMGKVGLHIDGLDFDLFIKKYYILKDEHKTLNDDKLFELVLKNIDFNDEYYSLKINSEYEIYIQNKIKGETKNIENINTNNKIINNEEKVSLDFEYSNNDIDAKNDIKKLLSDNDISLNEVSDSAGIHLFYKKSDEIKVKTLLNTEEFKQKYQSQIDYWYGIDNNGIKVNDFNIQVVNNYGGVVLKDSNEKFTALFTKGIVNDTKLIINQYNENTKEYEEISYKVSKNIKAKLLDKIYSEVENKALLVGAKEYQKSELLNVIRVYQNNILDEETSSQRQYECRRMNDILLKNLKNNIDEIQWLYNKTSIIINEWGKSKEIYDKFKAGFEELCNKYNITEEIYDKGYLYDKYGNEKIMALNKKPMGEELKDIVSKCLKNEYVSIDKIMNNEDLQFVLNNKKNAGEETIKDPSRKVMWGVYTDKYLEKIKSISGEVDNNGEMLYNGSILKNKKVEIVIGYPASGKSTISNQISNLTHARIVDSDEVKKLLPEYENGFGVEKVHEESKRILKLIIDKCIENNENLVLPIVGGKPEKINSFLKQFTDAGYDINISLVNLPKAKCMGRNILRYVETGRLIKPTVINDYNNPKDILEIIKNDIKSKGDSYEFNVKFINEYNNDVPYGHKPELEKAYKVNKSLQDITQVANIIYKEDTNKFTKTKIEKQVLKV